MLVFGLDRSRVSNPGLEGRNQTGFYLVPTRPGESRFCLAGSQHSGTGFQLRSCRSNRRMWYMDAIPTTPKTARLSDNVPTGQSCMKMVPHTAALYLMSLSHLLYQCISSDHMCWGENAYWSGPAAWRSTQGAMLCTLSEGTNVWMRDSPVSCLALERLPAIY